MFDSKFIATLFAVAISVFAICNINTNRITSNEGFGFGGLPSTTTRKDIVACNSMEDYHNGKCYSVPDPNRYIIDTKNKEDAILFMKKQKQKQQEQQKQQIREPYTHDESTSGYNKGEFFSTSNFEHMIPKRDTGFANLDPYARATVMWSKGQDNNQTSDPTQPMQPMGYADMVGSNSKEGYQRENFVESYGGENTHMKPNYSEGNYNSLAGGDLIVTSDLFPVQNMSSLNAVDKNGNPTQCVFFERIIHSNRNNRRRSQGDPIRGDLPIEPRQGDWFRVSSNINDLQQGALGVISGISETSTKMADFIKNAGGNSTIGGIDTSLSINQNMNTVQVSG